VHEVHQASILILTNHLATPVTPLADET